jgi:hypothetical protein
MLLTRGEWLTGWVEEVSIVHRLSGDPSKLAISVEGSSAFKKSPVPTVDMAERKRGALKPEEALGEQFHTRRTR